MKTQNLSRRQTVVNKATRNPRQSMTLVMDRKHKSVAVDPTQTQQAAAGSIGGGFQIQNFA